MIVPYYVDVPMSRWPLSNFAVIAVTFIAFALLASGGMDADTIESMAASRWNVQGMFTHLLLHAGPMHLIGNMVFLWVFGNAVCAKVGNLAFPLIYVGLGLVAVLVHLGVDGDPAIGASGAINGVVGMFLVWFPRNDVRCFYMIYFLPRTFTVSSFWMILLWLAFDIFGATLGSGGVAYWAHLGGFAAGFGLASALLSLGWIQMDRAEQSLYDVFAGRT